MLGTVKNYKPERGFGFIGPDDGSPDIFVHFRGLANGLDEAVLFPGARVEFDTIPGTHPGKLQATRVRPSDNRGPVAAPSPELAKSIRDVKAGLIQLLSSFELLLKQARAEGWDV